MCNLNRIGLLCTEPLLRILSHMRDEPITAGHCIHTLCLLSSSMETGGRIRNLAGADTIMELLPHQFRDMRGADTPQDIINLHNKNLRFTLRTLRNLTGPNLFLLQRPRLDTEANLLRVFDTLQVWMGDETSKGLTLQVLLNLSRISEKEGEPIQQDLPTPRTPTQTCTRLGRGDGMTGWGRQGTPWLSSTNWKRTPTRSDKPSGAYNTYPRNTTQLRCWE